MINEDIMHPKIYDKCNDVRFFLIFPAFSTYPIYQSMHNSRNITVISRGNKIPLDRKKICIMNTFFRKRWAIKNKCFVRTNTPLTLTGSIN